MRFSDDQAKHILKKLASRLGIHDLLSYITTITLKVTKQVFNIAAMYAFPETEIP